MYLNECIGSVFFLNTVQVHWYKKNSSSRYNSTTCKLHSPVYLYILCIYIYI